jgi:hypothetical protein
LISSDGPQLSPETQSPRPATTDDIAHVAEMAVKFISASPYRDVEVNIDDLESLIRSLIEGGILFVTDRGFIAGVISPLFFAPAIHVAAELAWWSEDGMGEQLREAFEDEAIKRGAQAVQMSVLNNNFASRLTKTLAEDGYHPVEVSFLKAL